MGENDSLSTKQYKFLSFLLAPMSVKEAAEKAVVSESTAYRWLNDSTFKQVLEASKSNLFEQGMSALQAKFVNAVQALERNLNAEQATAQIRAAQVIIEQTIANQHLVERIAELEALVSQQEQERMYHVSFDLRQLTREERDQLEAIEEARSNRQTKE